MNLQSLVIVILRLMSINFALTAAVQLLPQAFQYLHLSRQADVDFQSPMILPILIVALLFAAAVIMWTCAGRIARLVTSGAQEDISFGKLALVDCYSIAFMAVGLFYIASHLASVLNWFHFLIASPSPSSEGRSTFGYDAAQVFITFFVGILLFINGRKWGVALARKHKPTIE